MLPATKKAKTAAPKAKKPPKPKFSTTLVPRGGGFSLKVTGRPKFTAGLLTAVRNADPTKHQAGKNTLQAGLSRNHIVPWMTIAKELRTRTRAQPLSTHVGALSAHSFTSPQLGKNFAKLALSASSTPADVAKGAALVLRDRFNNPQNIYVGNSATNSLYGAQMKQAQKALSAHGRLLKQGKGAGTPGVLGPWHLGQVRKQFALRELDFPKHWSITQRQQARQRSDAAWKRGLSSQKY